MNATQLDFLRRYLEAHPDLQGRLRIEPPSYHGAGGWKRLMGLRVLGTGIGLELGGGRLVRLFPAGRMEGDREKSRQHFLRFLRRQLPAWKIVRMLARTDRLRGRTGAVLRLLVQRGSRRVAVLAMLPSKPVQLSERLLCAAVLWWHRLKETAGAHRVWILVPGFWSDSVTRLLPALQLPLRCFKYRFTTISGDTRPALCQIYPRGSDSSEVRAPYVIFPYSGDAPRLLHRLHAAHPRLDLLYRGKGWELAYRGLPIVWQDLVQGDCFFDWARPKALPADCGQQIDALVESILQLRSFPPPHPERLEYRFGGEKWLESVVLQQLHRLAPDLSGPVYAQVPTYMDGERKILDLLTVTEAGRLVVIELKARKDLSMFFQGLDYWQRVREHLLGGDFQRAGYFPGIRLSRAVPVWSCWRPCSSFTLTSPFSADMLVRVGFRSSAWESTRTGNAVSRF